jgi:hypothetical protein
MGER